MKEPGKRDKQQQGIWAISLRDLGEGKCTAWDVPKTIAPGKPSLPPRSLGILLWSVGELKY